MKNVHLLSIYTKKSILQQQGPGGLVVITPAFGARGPEFKPRAVFLFFSKTGSGKLDQIQFFLLAKCTLDIAKHFNIEI